MLACKQAPACTAVSVKLMTATQAALQVFDGSAQVLLYHLINSGTPAVSEGAVSKQPVEGQGQHSCMHVSVLHTTCSSTHLCYCSVPAECSMTLPIATCHLLYAHFAQNLFAAYLFCQSSMCLSTSYCNRAIALEAACMQSKYSWL